MNFVVVKIVRSVIRDNILIKLASKLKVLLDSILKKISEVCLRFNDSLYHDLFKKLK